MGDEHGEILQPQLFGLIDRHGIGRCGRLKANAKEDHFPLRVLLGNLHSVQRRIDNAHLPALAFNAKEIFAAAGDAQHVAKGAEDDIGLRGNRQRLVDHCQRGDTDGATRAVDQLDLLWQQLVNAVADDRMGLPAADFHDGPRASGDAVDLVKETACQVGIAKFIQVLHAVVLPPGDARQTLPLTTPSHGKGATTPVPTLHRVG